MTDEIDKKITELTNKYILEVSIEQARKSREIMPILFDKKVTIPDTVKKYQNLQFNAKYDKTVVRKYGIPVGVKLDTSPKFYNKISPSIIKTNDIKLIRTIDSEPYIEVIHFEGESLDNVKHPDEPAYSINTRYGTHYYHSVGSGVFYPISPKTLVACNKIHALTILGFDFMKCLINDDWGAFSFNTPDNLLSNGLFDITRNADISTLISAAKKYKSFREFLSAFFKTDLYISLRSPKQAIIDFYKPKLEEYLAVCSDATNTKYTNIYLSTFNHLLLDFNLYHLAKDKYDTIILTHEPSSYPNEHNIEILDISKTLRSSYAKLVRPKPDKYPTDFKYISDYYRYYPVSHENYQLLSDILNNEEPAGETKLRTYQGIKIIDDIIPDGKVIGSYTYGLQSIHTDIDIVFLVDKSHNVKQYIDKLVKLDFNNISYNHNDKAKLHRISGRYYGVDFDLDFFYESTHLHKVFLKELDLYSKLKQHTYVCNTIRLINQWYYNRKLAGSEFGYLHSTLFYALAIEHLDELSTTANTADTLRKFLSLCSKYTLKDFQSIAKKYDIMLIEDYAYMLLIDELKRADKYANLYHFVKMYKHISKKHIMKSLPHKISFTFNDPSPLNRSNDIKSIKYLIQKVQDKEIRLYLGSPKHNTVKLYIFSKEKIPETTIDAFVTETIKYNPKIQWTVKK